MPQGRRKVPFSGKKKKEQLKSKRQFKSEHVLNTANKREEGGSSHIQVDVLNLQPTKLGQNINRYNISVRSETPEERKQKLLECNNPIEPLPEEDLEVGYQDVFHEDEPLSIPLRPPWDYSLTKEELEKREQDYFKKYCKDLEDKYGTKLGYFEYNLETWRQLWRVTEMSDILLFIVDVRYPVQGFCPSLYTHMTETCKRHMILLLNKVDLVPPELALAWIEYFRSTFPKLHVLPVAAFPSKYRRRKDKPPKMSPQAALQIYEACEALVEGAVDLGAWKAKIQEDFEAANAEDDAPLEVEKEAERDDDTAPNPNREMYQNKILTIGCVGIPNVGKSSLINGLKGKKVVSVSRTPGHTKHFQTIFLTHNVRLCDCPGLVFPSFVPQSLQILMGCYPIAQVRVPKHPVLYLAQRVNLPKILRLTLDEGDDFWSASAICRAWAAKRDFHTARAARLDENRAANDILRKALDGRTICLSFYPPGFTKERSTWLSHPDLPKIKVLQATGMFQEQHQDEIEEEESESDSRSEEGEEDASSSEGEEQIEIASNKFALLVPE